MAEWNDGSSMDSGRSLGQHDAASGKDDPAAIRAGINETRERLSDTLNELGERLNPHVVKEQITERVKEGVREATIGRVEHMARNAANTVNATKSSITDTIRDNPVPAAMVAIGLGWLFFNGRRNTSDTNRSFQTDYGTSSFDDTRGTYARGGNFAGSYPYDTDYADGVSEGGASYTNRASGAIGNAKDRVSETAGNLADGVKSRAGQLAERTRSAASAVGERAQGVAQSVSTRTSQGKRRLEDAFTDNPLAVGAVTMALGVVAGLAAPRTDREVELFGDARERVADRARDVVHEAKDKVQNVAGRVIDETQRVVKEAVKAESGSTGTTGSMGSTGTTDIGL